MTGGERQPLLARECAASPSAYVRAQRSVASAAQRVQAAVLQAWPTLQLLALPHLLGLILSVATPAEVDAMRSLSCVHYYYLNPQSRASGVVLDTTSCQAPAVEVHFNSLVTRITFSVVLANFAGMLLYGRIFSSVSRKPFALMGMFGCALARIPLMILPLYQYPYLPPDVVRSITPQTMLLIYWSCAILGGFSGAAELVTLTIDSLAVDIESPEKRSQLFSQIQVAQLLGASIGPMLGSFVSWLFPAMANYCIGYDRCIYNKRLHSPQRGAQQYLLFNTASYWLAVLFAVLGMVWILFVVRFRTENYTSSSVPDCEQCRAQDQQHKATASTAKYAWLGVYQRLVPVHISGWKYDARILQFTVAEIFTAMMNEGLVVLILIMGYVFRWGRDLIAVGLSVFNTLSLFMIAGGLPLLVSGVSRCLKKPTAVEDLSQKQIDVVLAMSHSDVRRRPNCCPTYQRSSESRLLQNVSTHQRTLVRLWRAQVDLMVARLFYFSNTISWLLMAFGVETQREYVVLLGATLLTVGRPGQPMLRSAACTVADQIVDWQRQAALPLKRPRPGPTAAQPLPDGADSYLVIVSTVLLPCLLIGLVLRNLVYGNTIGTFPGAFFIVVALLNVGVVTILTWMRPPTQFYM